MENNNTEDQKQELTNEDTTVAPTEQAVKNSDEAEPKTSWYRNKLYVGFAILAIVIIAGAALIGLSSSTEQEMQTQQASEEIERPLNLASAIALTEGNVEFSTDNLSWEIAEGGETINVGDSVRTAADSRAIVLLDDGSAVRLDEKTKVKLITSDATSSEVMLVEGQVYSRVVASETRVYAVVTKNERFEALGTAYKISADENKDSLEVYQSKVIVESDEIEVEEGNRYDTEDKEKTSIDLDKLSDDEFVQWNKEKDQNDDNFKNKLGVLGIEPEKEAAPQPTTNPGATLSLSGSTSDKGISLNWTNSGVSAGDGFKVVYSKDDTTPSYKENSAQYVGAGSSSYTVGLDDGRVYYLRICAYRATSSTCDSYSNTVTATAPVIKKEAVKAGAVSLTIDGRTVSWSIAGTAPHGFKVLLNSEGSPTYPANSIQYVGSGTASVELPEKTEGTYSVRVCKYTADASISNGCTDYSNEVMYIVASE